MKKLMLVLSLAIACSVASSAQTAQTRASGEASNETTAAAKQAGRSVNLNSGTRLVAQLENSIDVRRAKVGDQVLFKTTQAIKSEGHTVVGKGARLVGHVTEVAQRSKGNGESRIGILFDRLEQGSLRMPIAATISSITSGNASANASTRNDDLFGSNASAGGSARSTISASTSSSGGGGGLLGGVGNVVNSPTSTVGSAVGGSIAALGSTVDSTTSIAGNTTTGVGRSLGAIQIFQSSNTSVEGGSTLSLQGSNLRLEKGTNFNLVLTQATNAGTAKEE